MEIIRRAILDPLGTLPQIRLPVDRLTLAKRRWRGVAEDGVEFGFDLDGPIFDGTPFFQTATSTYFIAQKYESVLEIRRPGIGGTGVGEAARLGWIIGNLHFQIEITSTVIRVVDDPAMRLLFARESIDYSACQRVFHPIHGGHQH
ncbi:MAG: urease accessory protein UreE [Armatimonadota bacterium]